ncbi:hypothetical protein CALVIDRAFT_539900 [Calocera viscosa TUFC12733]|uniref:Tubulin-tyrosine ligase n=1 Tax=Calocera viscosa (strain TUFC12733) TaxID=1330018 RepID=A0A167JCI2_CALVF|nr:hypothetical protein CALVIDRAFT_539900 [Calocera viscosa TUFC12733]
MSGPSPPTPFTAFVKFPSAFLTGLITITLRRQFPLLLILPSLPSPTPIPLLQFADYDVLDHELTLDHVNKQDVLSSSYVIRKSLIRKHYLASAVAQYLAKHPASLLATSVPRTWAVEMRFADELDEMWADELWDLGQEMDGQEEKEGQEKRWWILKPGMADKGQGIRMFSSKQELEDIFEEFEEDSDHDEDVEDEDMEPMNEQSTKISTQQMRHFVIQVCALLPPDALRLTSRRNTCPSLSCSTHYRPTPVRLHRTSSTSARTASPPAHPLSLSTSIRVCYASSPPPLSPTLPRRWTKTS